MFTPSLNFQARTYLWEFGEGVRTNRPTSVRGWLVPLHVYDQIDQSMADPEVFKPKAQTCSLDIFNV